MTTPFAPALGLLPQPSGTTGLPAYTGETVPRSLWVTDIALKRFVPRGKCQFDVPACTSYTAGKMFQTVAAVVTGRPGWWPELSYCALHQEVTGGQMNQGSRAATVSQHTAERGMIEPSAAVPEFYTQPRQLPAGPRDRMAGEWEEIVSMEQAVSAILNLQPVNIGLDWCERDANPGPTGELVMNPGGLLGGHSVVGCGVVMGYRHSPSGVGILIANHHGDSLTPNQRNEFGQELRSGVWGYDGFGVAPIERCQAGGEKYSSSVLRTVRVPDSWILA